MAALREAHRGREATITGALGQPPGSSRPAAPPRRWFAPPLRWIAHRGGALEAPENTLAAFRRALRLGADALELDVRCCAGGTLVVCHDETVERTTGGRGRVADLTLEELRGLDAAYWFVPGRGAVGGGDGAGRDRAGDPGAVAYPLRGAGLGVPAFEEVLAEVAAYPGDAGLVVEVKEPSGEVAAELAGIVDAYRARERVLCASFHDEPLAVLRRQGMATSASRSELARAWEAAHAGGGDALGQGGEVLASLGAVALQVPLRHDGAEVVTPALVRLAGARGLALHVWTVDDEADVARLRAAGVDGVITDRPGRFLRARGHRRARG